MLNDSNGIAASGGIENSHVAVIGGGISGLAMAYWLSKSGARVTLYEASNQLGGLGTFFSTVTFPSKNSITVCCQAINIC